MEQKRSFISEVVSMQEKRVSTLILSLIAILMLSFFLYITKGDIPETMLVIIQTLIYTVGGINGVNILTKGFSSNVEKVEKVEDSENIESNR